MAEGGRQKIALDIVSHHTLTTKKAASGLHVVHPTDCNGNSGSLKCLRRPISVKFMTRKCDVTSHFCYGDRIVPEHSKIVSFFS